MCTADEGPLGKAELNHFEVHGYVVKRAVLDPHLCSEAVDRAWSCLPKRLQPGKPWTWWGTVTDCTGTATLWKRRGVVKLREELCYEPPWLDLLPYNKTVLAVAEQLLGREQLERPKRIRGVYPTFPRLTIRRQTLRGHTDSRPYQLGVLGYLEDVRPGGGGFTVWPGSHRVLFFDFVSDPGSAKLPSYREHKAQFERGEHVEISGHRGDVVFYHHRLLHSAGPNHRIAVRQAILAEFARTDAPRLKRSFPPANLWEFWPGIRSAHA